MAQRTPATPEEIERLRTEVTRAEHELEDAKLAYYNSAEYQGANMPYERLKKYAEVFIAANHSLQKALYGRIRIRLDVSRLLRE
jgi:hypothetical protein